MASEKDFVEYIADQVQGAGAISYKKMFGEYGMYCNGKIFALVCDNRLFIKPTEKGRSFIGAPVETPPYQGAKLYFLIEDRVDDREWLSELVRITADELPEPVPKKKKTAKKK